MNITRTHTDEQIAGIAKVCHQANKAFCEYHNDFTQKDWDECSQWQRDSAINGVAYKLVNLAATPEDMHNSWSREKRDQGWVYDEVKDADKKTHPCLIPYENLPVFQRAKDALFANIVMALK